MKRSKMMNLLAVTMILGATAAAAGPKIEVEPLPDLIVQSASASEGVLEATVRNQGPADAPATSLHVQVKTSRGDLLIPLAVPALGPAGSSQVQIELGHSDSLKSVVLIADGQNAVEELREDNNSYTVI